MSTLQCYDCDVAIDINCGYGRSDYRQMVRFKLVVAIKSSLTIRLFVDM